VSSNYIWVLGLILSVVAAAILWINHMNTFATPGDVGEVRDPETHTTSKPVETEHRYKAMPSLSPTIAAAEVPADHDVEEKLVEDVLAAETKVLEVHDIPDNEDVELNLKLADQLQVIGDFEGVDDYARLVLDDDKASLRQKERAQALLRRDNNF
jgi:hypothetical protein